MPNAYIICGLDGSRTRNFPYGIPEDGILRPIIAGKHRSASPTEPRVLAFA
jgi:hypothetical protein